MLTPKVKCAGCGEYYPDGWPHTCDEALSASPACSNAYSGFDAVSVDGDAMSVRALKQAYRKHVKDDDAIGWDELSDTLGNALAQIMGDDEFCQWLQSI